MTAGLQLHMRDALLRGLQTVDNLLGNVLAVRTAQSVGTAAISVQNLDSTLMMIAFRKKSSKCTNSRGPNMTAGLQLHMRDALL